MRLQTTVLFFLLLLTPLFLQAQADGWVDLFDGETLNGWSQKGGNAPYAVQDGMIVGKTISNEENSFLTTNDEYDDFILEFEVWVDPQVNSGVQIRSLSSPDYRDGRVHGYQVELDPSQRAWSGGIYDEARRGWLYPITQSEKSQEAFKNGQWNKIRVEAIGNSINTWINDVQCARLVDDMTAKGFIALQVHYPYMEEMVGGKIKWRNIKIRTKNLEENRRKPDTQVKEISYLKNELTELEKRHGWRLLWNGKTSYGWRGAKIDHFPKSGWEMSDGILTIQETDGGESTGPGDIVTQNEFSNFELELEFKISKGANSGIKYFVDPELNQGPGSAIGAEFQILDDENHPDANAGIAGNRKVGSLYDLIAARNLSVPSRGKPFNGVGQWNKARIVSKDGHVEHWLNNIKVVEYDRFSQMFTALVAYSKYQKWEDFGQWPQGHILLQDHGNEVHYRSIKVREF
ncbi:DUF1080 domain-containing protein [Aliifodinibius sp. S!AR15-10]|uniref:3-keto-disaccharide hydrolase n=1 Tax=Aliifodinibius sp. S!AR15-10 TaxID=2950437 RepID=UPI0028657195|nr:DUF1080 domain-containing protein [Aliifodinibius sp. S!AR15-10]MDR8390067.1 DUF1080 domain-containing protein [Aliifodinibius sp. S!AR15-10]